MIKIFNPGIFLNFILLRKFFRQNITSNKKGDEIKKAEQFKETKEKKIEKIKAIKIINLMILLFDSIQII